MSKYSHKFRKNRPTPRDIEEEELLFLRHEQMERTIREINHEIDEIKELVTQSDGTPFA